MRLFQPRRFRRVLPALSALLASVLLGQAAQRTVSSAADISKLADQLRPGDVVVISDGIWKDQTVSFYGKGTAEQPILFRAQTPGKVLLTGTSSATIDGEHVVVSGLYLKDGESAKDSVLIKGHHCRLTESAIVNCRSKFFVHLFGASNRLDHCYLADKTSDSPTLQIEVEGRPNFHQIDHNHFGPRPPLGRNGGETIRVGYSHQSMTNSGTLVEHNLFDRCDGELEIISNKSCENRYRFNTFLDCAGMFTLRHGNRCLVEGNFILGHYKNGSGGIRVIGEDHTIINNYIEGVEKGGFWITAGISNSPLVGYFQASNCVIAFNTVIDSRGPYLDLSAGFGTSRRTLRPKNITIANNVFLLGKDGKLAQGGEGEGYKWMGNVAWSEHQTGAEMKRAGVRFVDPKLEKAADGIWRPSPASPARGAASGSFPAVKVDIDGQLRNAPFDAGCDQMSDTPVVNSPLTPASVGPKWLDRQQRE